MTQITKQEYAQTINTYIASKIDVFKSLDDPTKWEWEFIDDRGQPDMTRYTSRQAAMRAAIQHVKDNDSDAHEIAKGEAREWMKYNSYTMA